MRSTIWIVIAAVFLYDVTVYTGQFEIMKSSVAHITEDRRLQLLQFRFQVFVRHDQRLDGAAQVAVTHRDGLAAGLFIVIIVGHRSRF